MKKKVSVIMSAYNEEEEWLRNAIESIVKQTYTNLEIIIILDNANNTVLESIIKDYQKLDKRIIFYKNKKNLGLVASLNKALDFATGEYIARMDADDISELNRIEFQVRDLELNGYDLVATAMNFIDEKGSQIGNSAVYGKSIESCQESLKIRNILPHPTWLFKHEMVLEIGSYHNVHAAEDYELLCRCVCAGYRMHCMEDILFSYRIRSNSICVENAYQQHCVSEIVKKEYIKALSDTRMFEFEKIAEKLVKIDFSKKYNKYNNSLIIYKEGCNLIKGENKKKGIFLLIKAFVLSPLHIIHFVDTLQLRKVNK